MVPSEAKKQLWDDLKQKGYTHADARAAITAFFDNEVVTVQVTNPRGNRIIRSYQSIKSDIEQTSVDAFAQASNAEEE